MEKFFIATGGTGGHIIPARVLAEKLAKNHQVFVLADAKYLGYIKSEDNFSSLIINSSQIRKNFFGILSTISKISFGFLQSLFYFVKFKPKYVVAFGGYATFPILCAAIITRTKIILHEQNAHLGKVNRIFAKFAYKIALTFAETSGIKENFLAKCVVIGNPVRQEIAALNAIEYKLPEKKEIKKRDKMGYEGLVLASEFDDIDEFEKDQNYFNILVIGGSGGAKIFSEILPKAIFNLAENIKNNLHITQQCRSDLVSQTFETYEKFNINIEVSNFFDNMAEKISKAHLVIARSGSSSLVEFCAAKKPMILVPFAIAADNHQLKNARIVENAGAAIVIEEKDFTINEISRIISNLINNQNTLFKMSQNCNKIANLKAVENLENLILN